MPSDMRSRGSKGGKSRSERMTAEERKASASAAARARWARKIATKALVATGAVSRLVTLPAPLWAHVLARAEHRGISPDAWFGALIKAHAEGRLSERKEAPALPAPKPPGGPVVGFDPLTGQELRRP